MYHIHWNKIVIIFSFLLFVSGSVFSQVNHSSNLNFWDFRQKQFYFGLTLGVHNTGYIVSKSKSFGQNNINFVTGDSKSGLNVNIITNLKIGQYFDFRFIPGFAFSERSFFFLEPGDRTATDPDTGIEINVQPPSNVPDFNPRVESVFLEIPLLLRYKSAPYKDKRLFVVGGLKYVYDISSNSSTRQRDRDKQINLAAHDFQFEIGAGMQLFYPFFIFSPEIKFSRGINNIHIANPALDNSNAIDKILSRTFTISLHFEG